MQMNNFEVVAELQILPDDDDISAKGFMNHELKGKLQTM